MLKSDAMQLSPAERAWLPWLGKTGKLAMGWGTWLNKDRYPALEQAFEGFAATRVRILQSWAGRPGTSSTPWAGSLSRAFPTFLPGCSPPGRPYYATPARSP